MKQKCFKIYTPTHTYIYVSRGRVYTISWVPESCKSMTHFPPVTLVKYSQLRLFGPRHDFSANNTLAHVGYISLITHTLACTPWKSKNMRRERRDTTSFFPPPFAIRPGDFQFGPTTAGGKKRRPARSIFSMHRHSTHRHACNYCASPKRVRAEDAEVESVPRKSPGFRIQSEVRGRKHGKEYITLPYPASEPYSLPPFLPLFSIFPTMAHLNLISPTFPLANFAFFPFVPFLGERKRARNRGREETFSGTVAFREL